jgi:MFS family permease
VRSSAIGTGHDRLHPGGHFLPLSIVSIALLSLGNGSLSPTLLSQLSRNAEQQEQGEVLGMNQSFGSLARIVGPALGGRLYEYDHSLPYLVSGVIMLGGLYYVNGYLKAWRKRPAAVIQP